MKTKYKLRTMGKTSHVTNREVRVHAHYNLHVCELSGLFLKVLVHGGGGYRSGFTMLAECDKSSLLRAI